MTSPIHTPIRIFLFLDHQANFEWFAQKYQLASYIYFYHTVIERSWNKFLMKRYQSEKSVGKSYFL